MTAVYLTLLTLLQPVPLPSPKVVHDASAGRLDIAFQGQPFASYVYKDEVVRRPYFRDVHAPGGYRVTRRHPPEGEELKDHATMHPGLWLAYGDLGGVDFWRNKGRVRHEKFVVEPKVEKGKLTFTVANVCETSDGKQTICRETVRYTLTGRTDGSWLLLIDTAYRTDNEAIYFGDQEEMGLGVRLTLALIEQRGGKVCNSEGVEGARKAWGKQADWCDYHGTIKDRVVGVALLGAPKNFRKSWFHVRDYGLLVANPFGQNAFTRGPRSRVQIPSKEPLCLRFGVLLYANDPASPVDLTRAWKDYLALLQAGN